MCSATSFPIFFRRYQDTEGLALFRSKATEAEQDAKAIEDNHRNPTPEGDRRAEMLRVPKPDFHEFKQEYRFDPAKINWEDLKKVVITADTLKNTKDFDRVMRGYKSRNTYTVSGTVGGFYLKPTDVKLSFYQAKDGTVVPKLHGVQMDEKLLQRPYNGHEFSKPEQTALQGTGNLGSIAQIKDPKSVDTRVYQPGQVHARTGVYACGQMEMSRYRLRRKSKPGAESRL